MQRVFRIYLIKAGQLAALPYLVSGILSPFIGFYIDKHGKRGSLLCLSMLLLAMGHFWEMVLPQSADTLVVSLPLCLIGVGFAFFATSIWPSIPYFSKPEVLATAFGTAAAMQNMGLSIVPVFAGDIIELTRIYKHGFYYLSAFYGVISLAGFFMAIFLMIFDVKLTGG